MCENFSNNISLERKKNWVSNKIKVYIDEITDEDLKGNFSHNSYKKQVFVLFAKNYID